jgi:SAM-dependent methyltransferase
LTVTNKPHSRLTPDPWDDYAPFYDWENARTIGRRDVPFWRRVASEANGLVLELGCGTGRVSIPLVRAGTHLVGIDRSAQMLARLRSRARLASFGAAARGTLTLTRADIRELPFAAATFATVIAPYGVLQSLLCDRDLTATLNSVARVLRPGGVFGVDLVPDVPQWREYRNRVQLRGRAPGGAHLTLIESVRQDPRRRLTLFEQRYVERRGRHASEHRFELRFRTLSVLQMTSRLERAGFCVEAVLGDYHGRPWDERADVWIIRARRR